VASIAVLNPINCKKSSGKKHHLKEEITCKKAKKVKVINKKLILELKEQILAISRKALSKKKEIRIIFSKNLFTRKIITHRYKGSVI
jgi:hypothetical protein